MGTHLSSLNSNLQKMFAAVYGTGNDDNKKIISDKEKPVQVYTMNALSSVKSREALFICPFNDAHHVQKGKYMNHIFHCRRNPAHANYVECPFHQGHFLPSQEFLEFHVVNECPDAKEQTRKTAEEREYQRYSGKAKAPCAFDPDQAMGEG